MDKVLKDAQRLVRQGESYIKDKSEKGKIQLEIVALNLQREKLYYELGKVIARLPKNKWTVTKKPIDISPLDGGWTAGYPRDF